MARLTNAELNRLLIESQQANAALRQELSVLRAELERVRKELANAKQAQADAAQQTSARPPAHPAKRPYVPFANVRDEALRERMMRAREMAMKTGRAVRLELA